jgi:hypothetical protein
MRANVVGRHIIVAKTSGGALRNGQHTFLVWKARTTLGEHIRKIAALQPQSQTHTNASWAARSSGRPLADA